MKFIKIRNLAIDLSDVRLIQFVTQQRNDGNYGILVYCYWRDKPEPYVINEAFKDPFAVENFKINILFYLGIKEELPLAESFELPLPKSSELPLTKYSSIALLQELFEEQIDKWE